MSTSHSHFLHAKHNCDFLKSFYKSYAYNDWAITVSFYSALHIVEGAIFEKKKLKFSGEVITISHSDELERMIKKGKIQMNNPPTSLHLLRQSIVNENFKEIAEALYFLYNQSKTARYEKYQLENYIVNFSINYLNTIIKWAKRNFKSKFPITPISL